MTTANAILQAQGHVILPIISMSVGVALKAVSTYILIGIPSVGVLGAPIGSLICGFAVSAIDLWFVSKDADGELNTWRVFMLPLIAACPSIGAALALFGYAEAHGRGTTVALMLAIAVAVAVYGAVSFLIGNLRLDDLALVVRARKNKKADE
jgi:stage V sporulation protein B